VVQQVYGRTPAAEFGPKKLKAVRQAMVEKGWCRTYVNHQTDRVRRAFRWAAGEELVPGEVYHALQAVSGLRRGLPGVRESEPVRPVPEALIEAAKPSMPPPVGAMVELQLLTGMRPGEVVIMQAIDLDTAGRVWVYRPRTHKTEHHGKAREVYLGPRAQAVVRPWLKLDATAYLFSPAEAEAARDSKRRGQRKTPLWPSHLRHQARKRKARPKRAPADRYDVASYRRTIKRACDQAFSLAGALAAAPPARREAGEQQGLARPADPGGEGRGPRLEA
jgi:integrase